MLFSLQLLNYANDQTEIHLKEIKHQALLLSCCCIIIIILIHIENYNHLSHLVFNWCGSTTQKSKKKKVEMLL